MSADLLPSLATEIERLWRERRPTGARVRQLARGVLLEAVDAGPEADSLRVGPLPNGASLREEVLARNLLAARAVARMAVHFAPVQSDGEWLVAAALLTDVGRLRPGRTIVPREDRAHPTVGAALVAGMTDSPVYLTRLVSRHHERSDGSGFPAGLTAERLAIEDRLLASAVRFAELFVGDPIEASRRLHDEGRRGVLDPELTANLVWSITGELPADAGFGRAAARPWALTDLGRRRLRLDAGHAPLPRPQFARVRLSDSRSASFGRG